MGSLLYGTPATAHDIDDRALGLVCDFFDGLAVAEELPVGRPQDFDAAFLHHQIAGGVMTTTRRQLREIGMEHRFPALVEEVGVVRAEMGYPIMVTPVSQLVVTQAVANVLSYRHAMYLGPLALALVIAAWRAAPTPTESSSTTLTPTLIATPRRAATST